MAGYRDQDTGDVIFREPFCKASCVKAIRFDGLITIHNGNDNVTYQMTRSHPRLKHLCNTQLQHDHADYKGPRCKEIDDAGDVSTIWKSRSVGVLKSQDNYSTHNLAHKINLENLPSKISREFLILILFNSRF
ncbi:hypothetical protein Tco_0406996 [Tanacetum coccineum]